MVIRCRCCREVVEDENGKWKPYRIIYGYAICVECKVRPTFGI